MYRLKQKLLYVFILAIILIVCFYIFMPNLETHPKGVFLPNAGYTKAPAISTNNVKNKKLTDVKEIKGNVGEIVVVIHQYSKEASKSQLCLKNLDIAIRLAGEKGISEIKYVCSDIDDKSNLTLKAYAFREED